MQGNATEIDERNLLQLDALLSHGYGLSPQLVMRSKGLSMDPDNRTRVVEGSWKEDIRERVDSAYRPGININDFIKACNDRGVAVFRSKGGELQFVNMQLNHQRINAVNLDPKWARNLAFPGQHLKNASIEFKRQEKMAQIADMGKNEKSHDFNSLDHGDAHGAENITR